jgi:uncharacterized lipoprotein YmbA
MSRLVFAAALGLAAALCGCASTSTPARFHSLVPSDSAEVTTRSASALRVEVLPVTLPVQVDVPQIVVRLPDDSLRALEHERWIAPLADEIRAAIALRIDAVLAAASAPAAASQPLRVALEVQRFDSALGGAASLQALWSLQLPSGTVLRCQVNDRQTVADGPVALVAGHRALLQRLGDAIGRALRVAAAGGVPACA